MVKGWKVRVFSCKLFQITCLLQSLYRQTLAFKRSCKVTVAKLYISFMITKEGDAGHKISNLLTINTMNEYFVLRLGRFSVAIRANFPCSHYVHFVTDFLCRGLLPIAHFDIEHYGGMEVK